MKKIVLISLIVLCFSLVILSSAWAQNWAAIPPYNILWPLWSPVLSPPDPITGVPTPLVTQLTSSSILPVQPVLGWNPSSFEWPMSITMPWLFYNGPTGLLFFDVIYGMNPWPPPSLLDPTGAPNPIALAPDFTFSPLPLLKETQYILELGNLTYMFAYGNALGINPVSLLNAAAIWGYPPF